MAWINIAVLTVLGLMVCVGLVETLSWLAVRVCSKGTHVYKVFPISSEDAAEKQMSLLHASLEWDACPYTVHCVFYAEGLSDEKYAQCERLANDTGALCARTPEELARIMGRVDLHADTSAL